MKFSDAVERLRLWNPKRLAFAPTPLVVTETRTTLNKLQNLSAENPPIDISVLHSKLCVLAEKKEWEKISKREWRYVADCLPLDNKRLANDPDFMASYFQQLDEINSKNSVLRLIRYYLNFFEQNDFSTQEIGNYLNEKTKIMKWHWMKEEVSFFKPSKACVDVCNYIMESKKEPHELMEEIGFSGSLYGNRLAGHAYVLAGILLRQKTIQKGYIDEEKIKKFIKWGMVNDQFAFDSTEKALSKTADALLEPWSVHSPSDEIRDTIKSHLIFLLNDPRISKSKWVDVSERSRTVMLRWLAKISLEQFLELVDQTTNSHMWSARKKFWSAFYEQEYMTEAWVAFAASGASAARNLAADSNNPFLAHFGELEGPSVLKDHAVLIMKIGNLLIADWSHSGKCHIWDAADVNAPKLYKKKYTKKELEFKSAYSKIHNGNWQYPIYSVIRGYAGIHMPNTEFME